MITLVAAVAQNSALGKDNTIPWHVPEDFKHFKAYTLGKALVMGRKTFESIGKPLPGRETIVVTRDKAWAFPGVQVEASLAPLLKAASKSEEELIIAGGAEIYKQALSHADKVVLSEIPVVVEDADALFPKLEEEIWQLASVEASLTFTVKTFLRRKS